MLRTRPGTAAAFDMADLESRVVEAATSWHDGLRTALFEQVDEVLAARYLHDYGAAFPGGYREDCHPRVAVGDIGHIEHALAGGSLAVHLYQPELEHGVRLHVRLYAPGSAVSLSRAIPMLEHMGLRVHDERPYRIRHPDGPVWIHDFSAEHDLGQAPGERVSVEAAIRAVTRNAAWACHSETEIGSLEAGKFADLVILDSDPRKVEPREIADIRISETWMDGKQVYAS